MKHSVDFPSHLKNNGLPVSDAQLTLLDTYVLALLEWNQKVNLISRKDEENIWTGHILHALSILFRVDLPVELTVLDLGTGGGLPGIPLAIMREGWSVVLMDSIQKKCTVVRDISERLGLSGRIRVECGRAEEKTLTGKMGGMFDVVLARGVAPLADLVRWSRPYVRAGRPGSVSEESGHRWHVVPPVLLAYKGGDLDAEITAMKIKARADVSAAIPLVFKGSDTMGLMEKKLIVVTL